MANGSRFDASKAKFDVFAILVCMKGGKDGKCFDDRVTQYSIRSSITAAVGQEFRAILWGKCVPIGDTDPIFSHVKSVPNFSNFSTHPARLRYSETRPRARTSLATGS